MSDNIPTSPFEGSAAAPTAPSEPSGVAAPAQAVTPPAPAAISSTAPATGTAAPPAPQSQADLAFDQLMADPNANDNPPPVFAPPAQPAAPPAPVQAAPAPQAPPASDPPAAEHDDPEPSVTEQQEGKAPVKKLIRALRDRKEFRAQAETATQQLAQEKALTDRVLNAFNAAGIDANSLPGFMSNLARHRNDPQAQAQLLASLGVQAPRPQQAFDLAAVRARLEAYDAEGALALINASAQPPQPAPTPQQAPVVQQPSQAPAPQQMPNVLIQTVATMGSVLRATYGDQEAGRLAAIIDSEAKARIQEMDELGAVVTPEAAAKVWQKAQGTVLRSEAQKRAAPPVPPTAPQAPPIRPAQPPPPKPLTADEAFAQLQATGR